MEHDVDKQKRAEIEELISDVVKVRLGNQQQQVSLARLTMASMKYMVARSMVSRTIFRKLSILIIIFSLAMSSVAVLWPLFRPQPPSDIAFGEMRRILVQKKVRYVALADGAIEAELNDHRIVRAQVPAMEASQLWADLVMSGASLGAKTQQSRWSTGRIIMVCVGVGIAGLLIGLFLRFRSLQQSSTLALGKSRPRLHSSQRKKVTLKEFVAPEHTLEPIRRTIDFLNEPQKYQKLGAHICKGTLLVGPPGSGKTYLARVLACECNIPFLSISATEFVEVYPGVGASRMRDLFEQGKKNAPCFLFIDDLDAIGRRRSAHMDPLLLEQQITLNQLLVEMEGFESNEGVLVLAATNRPDLLDEALLHPGRFETVVELGYLSEEEVSKAFSICLKKIPLADDVDVGILAARLHTGSQNIVAADVAHTVNSAAELAAESRAKVVTMDAFVRAMDKRPKPKVLQADPQDV